jgi:hypothetical protein
MNVPFYMPWKGDIYESSSPRLLLLGESHYGDAAEHGNATIQLTQDYISGEMNHRFWTDTMNAVRGKPSSVEDRTTFWQSVAFYNFVQKSAGASAGIAPTKEMFDASVEAFFTMLDELKPRAILVLSTRLWNNLPGTGHRSQEGPLLEDGGKTRSTWIYNHTDGQALATWIPHPSLYFSWRRWHPWIEALKKASVT